MGEQTIKCPKCNAIIPLSEALTSQIEGAIRAAYETEAKQREQEFAKQLAALKQREKEIAAAKETLDEQVNEKLKVERAGLAQQKKALDEQRLQIDEQVSAKMRSERQRLSEEAMKKAKEEIAGTTKAMEDELAEKRAKLAEANRKELEFLNEKRLFEEQKANMQLEIARKMDEERKKVVEEAAKKADEANMLKMREKDDQLTAMKRQIDELKRKAETGSQEAQGEALEGSLRDKLTQMFALDIIEDVKKGARGADLVQRVRNHQLKECGMILWEAKNAQNFSREWIAKLKSDQQEAGADVAVLATMTLPKEIDMFGMVDDVWVTDYKNAVCLSMALRHGLINVAREKVVAANQDTVKDVVYRYVTGPEFGMQVRSMVGAFKRMQEDLDSEKRAMQKYWKSREKQIEVLVGGVTNIYAAVEGYAGHKALPQIDPLLLDTPPEAQLD